MKIRQNLRTNVTSTVFCDDYVQPDQSMTIGDLLQRHIDSTEISNHMAEAVEDVNIDSPMRYDTELTDIPTKYQDKDYFDRLESMHKSISSPSAIDNNPNNLNSSSNVQSIENNPKGV